MWPRSRKLGARPVLQVRSPLVVGVVAAERVVSEASVSFGVRLLDGDQVLLDGARRAVVGDVDVDSGVVELLDDGDVIGVLGAEPSEVGDDEPGHVLPLDGIEHAWQTVATAPDVGEDLGDGQDRKSTRLNSSHVAISYAVFCLKKKTQRNEHSH